MLYKARVNSSIHDDSGANDIMRRQQGKILLFHKSGSMFIDTRESWYWKSFTLNILEKIPEEKDSDWGSSPVWTSKTPHPAHNAYGISMPEMMKKAVATAPLSAHAGNKILLLLEERTQ